MTKHRIADYIIREIERRDMEAVINLCEEHSAFEGCTYDKSGKLDKLSEFLFKEDPGIKCVVVEEGSEIKGYATYMVEFSTWDAQYYMHMDCLYLKPDIRGKRIGRKIMDLIYIEAKRLGCVNVQWQTPIDNEPAILFYNKLTPKSKRKIRFFWPC